MNRRLYLPLLFAMLLPLSMTAQDGFSYQAVARDNSRAILTNTTVNLRFQIRETDASGSLVYQETHSPTTNIFGLMALTIGEGTVETGDFSAIDWGI